MDKDSIVVEYLKIYFNCHPGEMPKDTDQALKLMSSLHKKFKTKIIVDFKSKSEDFVNKFLDDDKGKYR